MNLSRKLGLFLGPILFFIGTDLRSVPVLEKGDVVIAIWMIIGYGILSLSTTYALFCTYFCFIRVGSQIVVAGRA